MGKNYLEKIKQTLRSDKLKLSVLVFIILAIPITIILVLNQQNILTLASDQDYTPKAALKDNPPKPFVDEPQRGLVWAGIKANENARCNNAFEIVDQNGNFSGCTHGPDPGPEGVDVSEDYSGEFATAQDVINSNNISCVGDGTTGQRIQMIYAVPGDRVDRYDELYNNFQIWGGKMDLALNDSALKTGGESHFRFTTNPDCSLNVLKLILSSVSDDSFTNTITELQSLGFNQSDKKYVIWMDASVYCGIAQVRIDDSPGLTNLNNVRGGYARIDAGCWGRADHLSELHELMHTLGAVQPSALNATVGMHCKDEYDAMCYKDASDVVMSYSCVPSSQEWYLDCNNDDYFAVNPAPGSYLATHWNIANSGFLTTINSAPTPTGILSQFPTITPSVAPTKAPTPTFTPTPTPFFTPTPTVGQMDNISPTISFVVPTNNSTVTKNAILYLTMNVSDNIGISKVETYVNGKLNCTISGSSSNIYQCGWKVPAKKNGKYTITAKAYDNSNNSISASVNVVSQ